MNRDHRSRAWILLLCVLLTGRLLAQAPDPAASGNEGAAAPPAFADTSAQAFLKTCAGCHTIGGGPLSGPDLKASSAWPRQNLFDAIKRMEKNVGPMSDDLVNGMADFLAVPDASERLKLEQQRVAIEEAAKLDPASAATGERLFQGNQPFNKGGLACIACHQAGGSGGDLAVSLEDAFTRLGEAPLLSTCENPGFPLMRAAYATRPLTRQEAVHVVKYLESVSQQSVAAQVFPLHGISVMGTVLLLAGLGRVQRHRLQGVRARLVSGALQRGRRAAAGRKERQ